jgi:septal ring-binding cell division protein DamX
MIEPGIVPVRLTVIAANQPVAPNPVTVAARIPSSPPGVPVDVDYTGKSTASAEVSGQPHDADSIAGQGTVSDGLRGQEQTPYSLQIAALSNQQNAERLRAEMEARLGSARLVFVAKAPAFWRVWVGRFATPQQARAAGERLREDYPRLFVVRND